MQVCHRVHNLQFVKDSLKNDVTLRGMKIKTSLQAEDTDSRLRKRWKNIIQTTQVKLLKVLKEHHREQSESLKTQISMMKTHSGEEKESFWIFILRTLAPEGLNLDG